MLGRSCIHNATRVGGGLAVVHDGIGGYDDAVPRPPGTPAEVDVVAEHRQRRIKSTEGIPDVPAHEHARSADGQNIADPVVLALVEFAAFETGDPVPGTSHGDTTFDEHRLVAPAPQLRSQDLDRVVTVRSQQQ
ncbi:unannotated protein [freshwater metagenome]|uniref:Unannotated protein n=1 Tax=freshwater metagenome TaxID=449393 RepID=A0A6J7CAK1_9ZZZZ